MALCVRCHSEFYRKMETKKEKGENCFWKMQDRGQEEKHLTEHGGLSRLTRLAPSSLAV